MSERRFLALPFLVALALLLSGHSPYRQWHVYRAKHLIVVADEMRPRALPLAAAVASAIAARWPKTQAVPAAAKRPIDVVKLLHTGQLQVGLLPGATALAAFEGRGPFAEDGNVPLRVLAVLGDDLLVVLETCARAKAREITQAIAEHRGGWPLAVEPALRGPAPIPFHAGALDYYEARATPGG